MSRPVLHALRRPFPFLNTPALLRLTSTTTPRAAAVSSVSTGEILGPQELHGIEERWENMHPKEQADIWMKLRDRMKGNWRELSVLEKKASYYVAFGPHGPRTLPPPGEWKKVFMYTMASMGLTWFFFLTRELGARPAPKTMTPEWQEASNERMRAQGVEPLTGISSDYPTRHGKGYIQSDTGIVGWEVGVKGVADRTHNRDGRGIELRKMEKEARERGD